MMSRDSDAQGPKPCVIALHCSLSSGRQWSKLTQALDPGYQVIAPDISGYGDKRGWLELPVTLADEIAFLGDDIAGDGTHTSRRPFLWRRDRFQNGDKLAICRAHPQPDVDRARTADAARRR
jgi:hypothetical protein